MKFAVLKQVNWWLFLVTGLLALIGVVFVHSATLDRPEVQEQPGKQVLFVVCSLGIAVFAMMPHYAHIRRLAWPAYLAVIAGLVGLWFFAPTINGARRWYALPGFSIQPAEFAKLAVVVALASLLRFQARARTFDGLIVPFLVVALPAALVMKQPDLGSSLVFWPVLLAMCYAAGAPGRSIVVLLLLGALAAVLGYFTMFHGYQKDRVSTWARHFSWLDEETTRQKAPGANADAVDAALAANEDGKPAAAVVEKPESREDLLRGKAYQPWQALIALGGGGFTGHGLGQGPQNRYDFLPYRSEDYVFAVVGEETGWLGCVGVLSLHGVLFFGLLGVAFRTRERFGRLLCVGVAAWIGSQTLMHAAVCAWMVPSTGVPMPLISYGGSSTFVAVLGIALCLNVSARREPVLAGDGFQ